jgi:hypothetical protein
MPAFVAPIRVLHQAMSPLKSDGTNLFFFFLRGFQSCVNAFLLSYSAVMALVLAATVNRLLDRAERPERRCFIGNCSIVENI